MQLLHGCQKGVPVSRISRWGQVFVDFGCPAP